MVEQGTEGEIASAGQFGVRNRTVWEEYYLLQPLIFSIVMLEADIHVPNCAGI